MRKIQLKSKYSKLRTAGSPFQGLCKTTGFTGGRLFSQQRLFRHSFAPPAGRTIKYPFSISQWWNV
jgi:hypothetical protein